MNLADSLCSLLEQGWEGQLKSMPASCIPPFRWVGIAKLENKSDDSPAWQTVLYYYRLKVSYMYMYTVVIHIHVHKVHL